MNKAILLTTILAGLTACNDNNTTGATNGNTETKSQQAPTIVITDRPIPAPRSKGAGHF